MITASITAAAGCGKTEEIVTRTKDCACGKTLVLTHTHAGIAALQRRFEKHVVPPAYFSLHTIDGFALRWASAYPELSMFEIPEPDHDYEWPEVHAAATRLLANRHIQAAVCASYRQVFVDEYQDCSKLQHALITALAHMLPTRVFGDPLQAIFDFRGGGVSWADVESIFPHETELCVPYRWASTNPELGEWLGDVRRALLAGEAIDLQHAPIYRLQLGKDYSASRSACMGALGRAKKGESAAAITMWEPQANFLAKQLAGTFPVVEPFEGARLSKCARDLDGSTGALRAANVIGFIADCMTRVDPSLKALEDALRTARFVASRYKKLPNVARAAEQCVSSGSARDIQNLLDVVRQTCPVPLHRRDLYKQFERVTTMVGRGESKDYITAARAVMEKDRLIGRHRRKSCTGRTVLLKGLEFDHVVVFESEQMNANNLYVALTRASRSLAIVTDCDVLSPPSSPKDGYLVPA